MHRIGPLSGVTSSAGDVDLNGDVTGLLLDRLRAQVGPHRTPAIDPDAHAVYVAELVRVGRAGLTPAAVIA